MRTLEEVLKDLEEAEKEFQEKCDVYGIKDDTKKKKETEVEENKDEASVNNDQLFLMIKQLLVSREAGKVILTKITKNIISIKKYILKVYFKYILQYILIKRRII